MERFYNFCFYSTWRLLNACGDKVFKYISFIMYKLFPFLEKNKKKAKESFQSVGQDRYFSVNIYFAISYMNATTIIIYFLFFVYSYYLLDLVFIEDIGHAFIAIFVLSYITNKILFLHNDKYLKYFDEFDKKCKKPMMIYLTAVLFHLGTLVLLILTMFWIKGFKF